MSRMHGFYNIAQTPFQDDGSLDLYSIGTLSEFYIRHGVDGFTVLGVSGEAGKLTYDESIAVVKAYISHAEGRDVIVGVSNSNLRSLTLLTGDVMALGAKGVMIAPAAGLKTDEEIFSYFGHVFKAIDNVPTVLQDFPGATGVHMSAATIAGLASQFPQICALKEEDLPHLNKISRLKNEYGFERPIFTGNNALYFPLEMARGIDGPMAGFSFPEVLAQTYALYVAGEADRANDIFDRYLPLIRYEAMGFWGVAARKEVMRRRGAIRSARMRTPGPVLTPVDMTEIDYLLARITREN